MEGKISRHAVMGRGGARAVRSGQTGGGSALFNRPERRKTWEKQPPRHGGTAARPAAGVRREGSGRVQPEGSGGYGDGAAGAQPATARSSPGPGPAVRSSWRNKSARSRRRQTGFQEPLDCSQNPRNEPKRRPEGAQSAALRLSQRV